MVKKIWDYTIEKEFFPSRGKIKNPRPRVAKTATKPVKIAPPKRRGFGRGNAYQNTRSGPRPGFPGIIFRSDWEYKVALILKMHQVSFDFEPQSFIFPPNKNGRVEAYLPDFRLNLKGGDYEWLEVKGWLDSKGRSKLRRFKKHYPDEFARLSVVISRSNKTNQTFFTKLGVKTILYYENLKEIYSDKIQDWK